MKRHLQHGNAVTIAIACALLLVSNCFAAGQPHAAPPRTPGYLGVAFHDAPTGHGAEIVMVDHDGPAGKAGLQPHDIVVKLNGLAIESGAALSKMIHETGAGAQIALAVMRGGRSMTMTTELADKNQVARSSWQDHWNAAASEEDSATAPASFVTAAPATIPQTKSPGFIENMLRFGPYTGLMLGVMEPQLAGFFGCPNGKGLLVHGVEANSPAAAAGLRAGDVLLRADGAPLNSTSDWSKSLRAAKGHQMALTVLREHHEVPLTLLPDAKKHSMVEWPIMSQADGAVIQ